MTTRTHPPAISVEGLTKRYGRRAAVDAVSFEIPAGAVAGFIGPNGAGKTTTMAMLLGLVTPTSGSGTVLGMALERPADYLGRVGALIEAPAFWPGLTGAENLRAMAVLGDHDVADVPDVLDVVGLRDRGDDRFGEYSFGMKQRLGLAAALLGDPDLLVLDEPTNGLDPAGITEMRRLIADLARDDRTVLVSSHILAELEQVSDWLLIIDDGALIYQGRADQFLKRAATVIELAPERSADLRRLDALVRAGGHTTALDGEALTVPVNGGEPHALSASLNRLAGDAGIVLAEVHVRRPTLESHYLATVEGAHR